MLAAAALLLAGAARAADSSPPQLTHTPVTKGAAGPLKITARISDESKIFPQIFLRTAGAPAFDAPVDLKKAKGSKDVYEVTVPAKAGLEYYLECYDEYGNGPARAGSPEQPFKVEVEEAGATPPRAAPWLKGAGADLPIPAPDQRKLATPLSAPAPGAAPASAAAPAPSAASEMVAAVEAASSREVARAAPSAEKPAPERARETAPEHHAEKVDKPAPEKPRSLEPLRERPLTTTLEGPGPIGAEGALVRSLLLPGFGQFKTGRPVRGAILGGATAAALVTTIVLAARAKEAGNIYEGAPISVQPEARDQADRYARARNIALLVTAALWLGTAAEAYLGFGTHD